ncbi:MAG: hypothetical protein JSV41_07420 [Gemmatimonadota bacterium]|nr:MAG: hypothetical protein JSV41_07420 [Gemmatimonadota bacterium]
MPAARSFWGALLVLLAAACGSPVVFDTAGRPVAEPKLMARADGLVLVVDSSAAGIRAVLQLRIDAPEGSILHWERTGLRLWTGSRPAVGPAHLRQGPLRCWPSVSDRARCRERYGDTEVCVYGVQPGEAECYYILSAEFPLKELPNPKDPVLLSVGGSLTILQMAAVK